MYSMHYWNLLWSFLNSFLSFVCEFLSWRISGFFGYIRPVFWIGYDDIWIMYWYWTWMFLSFLAWSDDFAMFYDSDVCCIIRCPFIIDQMQQRMSHIKYHAMNHKFPRFEWERKDSISGLVIIISPVQNVRTAGTGDGAFVSWPPVYPTSLHEGFDFPSASWHAGRLHCRRVQRLSLQLCVIAIFCEEQARFLCVNTFWLWAGCKVLR